MKNSKPSEKQLNLISMYEQMAKNGYQTIDDIHIAAAFNDMEIMAFKNRIKKLFTRFEIKSLLDYGCGGSDYEVKGFSGDFSAKEFFGLNEVWLYEPARNIDQRRVSDATVCFDVLEHVFVADISRVVRELFSLTRKLLVVNVACYSAGALLPNGENAHISVRPPLWWRGIFDCIAPEYPHVYVQLYCSTGWRQVQEFNLYSVNDWYSQEGFIVNL